MAEIRGSPEATTMAVHGCFLSRLNLKGKLVAKDLLMTHDPKIQTNLKQRRIRDIMEVKNYNRKSRMQPDLSMQGEEGFNEGL